MTGGRVTLVGGGPGDEDLLTVKAVKALAAADLVLYDRLAPHEHLAALAPHAELIDVGKRPGHHPVGQDSIERIMIDRALAGADVVRLKGGDPYVFGRGGEEVEACRRAGVEVHVVPGVTSAVSVPAAAGIPVTYREVSRMFTVVSGHVPLSEPELQHLAALESTIVVLMGVANLPSITAGLVRHGLRAGTPVAIVERGQTPRQRTVVTTLERAVWDAAAAAVESPAVLVIGEVVACADPGAAALLATAPLAAVPAGS